MNKELIALIPTLPLIENPEDINESTRLEADLQLFGFQARSFMYRYSEVFHVDISKFRISKYFSKDTASMRFYRRFFKRRKDILTMGDLDKAIRYKRINEAVLEDIAPKNTDKAEHNKINFRTSYHFSPEEAVIYILIFIALVVFLAILAIIVA